MNTNPNTSFGNLNLSFGLFPTVSPEEPIPQPKAWMDARIIAGDLKRTTAEFFGENAEKHNQFFQELKNAYIEAFDRHQERANKEVQDLYQQLSSYRSCLRKLRFSFTREYRAKRKDLKCRILELEAKLSEMHSEHWVSRRKLLNSQLLEFKAVVNHYLFENGFKMSSACLNLVAQTPYESYSWVIE